MRRRAPDHPQHRRQRSGERMSPTLSLTTASCRQVPPRGIRVGRVTGCGGPVWPGVTTDRFRMPNQARCRIRGDDEAGLLRPSGFGADATTTAPLSAPHRSARTSTQSTTWPESMRDAANCYSRRAGALPVDGRSSTVTFTGERVARTDTPWGTCIPPLVCDTVGSSRRSNPEGVPVCRPAECPKCGKTTWSGCGRHVDSVMDAVPQSQRCTCDHSASSSSGGLRSLFRR